MCSTTNDNFYKKFIFFNQCINSEGKKSKFLNIGGVDEDFLTGKEPVPASGDWPRSRAIRHMIKTAIWQFYQVFNADQYKSFQEPDGVLTTVIWAKFRDLYRNWYILHSSLQRVIESNIKAQRESERAIANLKRREKERTQMLILGEGDIEKGRKKFIKRMHRQKHVKANRVNNVSLSLEKSFAKWLITDEAKEYTRPMKCHAPKQFNQQNNQKYNKESRINVKVKNILGVINALEQLSEHPSASKLTIYGVLNWNEQVAFSNPRSHTCPRSNEVFDLFNYGRVYQNQRMKIIGYLNNGTHYIVSSDICNAHRDLPKRFEKLEYRNKKISSDMNVLYNIDHSLRRLEVIRFDQGVKYIMNIDILYNGKETVDINQIFVNHIIRDLMKESTN